MRNTRPTTFDAAKFIAAHRAVGNVVSIVRMPGRKPLLSVGALDGLNPLSLRQERAFARQRRADPDYIAKIAEALRLEEATHV